MALLDSLGTLNGDVSIDKSSVDYVAKMLIVVIAVGLILWLIARKIAIK